MLYQFLCDAETISWSLAASKLLLLVENGAGLRRAAYECHLKQLFREEQEEEEEEEEVLCTLSTFVVAASLAVSESMISASMIYVHFYASIPPIPVRVRLKILSVNFLSLQASIKE